MEALAERIKSFLSIGDGPGYGYGYGYGDGYGDGPGYGYGDGYGDGYGYGDGCGCGCGCGSGYGCGSGSGYGSDYGDGIKIFDGKPVHQIDGIATILTSVRGSVAKGFILQSDLALKPCFVAKSGDCFAHGETLEKAVRDAEAKAFQSLSVEDRIAQFKERFNATDRYPAKEFFEWHGRLTGSCKMGRTQFVQDQGIDLEATTYTVAEFVALTKDSYRGDVVAMLQTFGEGE